MQFLFKWQVINTALMNYSETSAVAANDCSLDASVFIYLFILNQIWYLAAVRQEEKETGLQPLIFILKFL